ncbi:MAG: multiheme c-type cytochrome [Gammaproteobacteria bacterium]|nr:multiheme c-type cytochrome [Gammaproteobacteria bacterium]
MTVGRNPDVVGPGMRKLLLVVLVLFAVLVVDSVYLGAITFLQWLNGVNLEDEVYQSAFLVHLALGFAIVVPAIVYAILHLRRAFDQPNRLAVRLGLVLFATVLLLLGSGIALTRGIPLGELRHPIAREVTYWLHIATPLIAGWLFVLHRLAGQPVRWRVGGSIAAISLMLSFAGVWLADPKDSGPEGEPEFFPSLARTSTGRAIAAEDLMREDYCAQCHEDIHAQWQHSAHRFASFNNPAYLFSVRNTRAVALERDGNVKAARFCAGCHDPVPLFSGAFDDPDFDDVNHPTANAGITCVACHAIEHLGSPRGNSDYVIAAPVHYPFAFSENPILAWVNGLLIKGKPAFHKRTFMKPLHRTSEFCGTCHKVHLPEELNKYRWLRGQNHYDSFLLSGVSGHGVQSFYYPDKSVTRCSECHMPLTASLDFAARPNDATGALTIHGHHFPGANTALAHLLDLPSEVNEAHRAMLQGALRVDLFAIRAGTAIDGPVIAPLRPEIPTLLPGRTYVLDIVVRTLKVGHTFTEGTADSNEVWLDVSVLNGDEVIGRSGALAPVDGEVDPWSHFVNAYVLDRKGNRIDRRNAEDIFTKLYDHQIPPGAADVVHYQFSVPPSATMPVEVSVSLRYRKFDTTYLRSFQGEAFTSNDLPVVTIATDKIVFSVQGTGTSGAVPDVPVWERWNDYGIGLLRKPDRGELRQAEEAFRVVANLGRAEGDLNLARVLIREGRLDEAGDALSKASAGGAYPWSVTWFSGLVDLQNGEIDTAIEAFTALIDTRFTEARRRGFDFSFDYRLRNKLAQALFERAKLANSTVEESEWLNLSAAQFGEALNLDPENLTAHYGLAQIHARLGDNTRAEDHRKLHEVYRRDDNAHDQAVAAARRRDAAANHASEAVVIYDLQRQGTYGLGTVR